MQRARFFLWLLAGLCLGALSSPGLPQTHALAPEAMTPLSVGQSRQEPPQPIVLSRFDASLVASHVGVREKVLGTATVEQVAQSESGAFKPFQPDKAYDFDSQHALWLHFRVLAEEPGASPGWTVEFTKPYINRIDFYYRDEQGLWKQQTAGLNIAHVQWPQRGLWPQFSLPSLQQGINDFYVRIYEVVPVQVPLRFQTTSVVTAELQVVFLKSGLILGLIALMVVLSAVLAAAYRNPTYAWYSLYALLSLLAAAAHIGIAKRMLWPQLGLWGASATLVLTMAAVAAQLQFCRSMFLATVPSRFWNLSSSTIVAITVFLMPVCAALHEKATLQLCLFVFAVIACVAQMLVLACRALPLERRIAVLWLVAYFPLLVSLTLTIINILTPVAWAWLSEDAVMYGLVFEVPVLLIALHLHAKSQHARQVHGSVLAAIDPLTGFIPPQRFEATLASAWKGAQRRKRDLAVAYIEVSQLASTVTGETAPLALSHPKTTSRIVRMLRTAALEHDTVARLNFKVFALLMPGMPPGELLASRLARLVALSLMADTEDPQGGALRLRIVASTSRTFAGSWQELNQALQHKLKMTEGWAQRAIRFVRQQRAPPPDPLDEMWERATQESAK